VYQSIPRNISEISKKYINQYFLRHNIFTHRSSHGRTTRISAGNEHNAVVNRRQAEERVSITREEMHGT